MQTLGELEFWKINLRSINGKEIKTSKELSELKIFSDASDSGFGAYVENSEISEVVGLWTGE